MNCIATQDIEEGGGRAGWGLVGGGMGIKCLPRNFFCLANNHDMNWICLLWQFRVGWGVATVPQISESYVWQVEITHSIWKWLIFTKKQLIVNLTKHKIFFCEHTEACYDDVIRRSTHLWIMVYSCAFFSSFQAFGNIQSDATTLMSLLEQLLQLDDHVLMGYASIIVDSFKCLLEPEVPLKVVALTVQVWKQLNIVMPRRLVTGKHLSLKDFCNLQKSWNFLFNFSTLEKSLSSVKMSEVLGKVMKFYSS